MKPTTKYFLTLFLSITTVTFSQKRKSQITGIVTDGHSPLGNASILIKGTTRGVFTDVDGEYSIQATPKDVLIYAHIGMKSLEIVVEDVTIRLNVEMRPNIEKLDEVVVTKSKRKTQKDLKIEYATNKNIVNSGFGYLNKETAGYAMKVVDGNELNPAAISLLNALQGKYPGLGIGTISKTPARLQEILGVNGQAMGDEEALFFGRSSFPAIFEIDGQVFTSAPNWLDIETIDRIALIPGLGFAAKYGSEAKGGVVIINTKNAGNGLRENGTSLSYDQAKLRNNIYANDAVSQKAIRKNEPIYLRDLYATLNTEEAISVYEKHKKNFGDSYVFVLEVYRFFQERYGNVASTNQIIDDNEVLFEENPLAIKALAYIHQSNGNLERANVLYKTIFLLRPDYGQSYLDLANSYRDIKAYTKSVALYTRYNHLIANELIKKDSSQFFEIIERDFNNLIVLKGKEIISDKAFENNILEEDFQGTRLVFEWNDGEAEFELQFVNPQGHYFIAEHSLFANAAEIQQEKQIGYSCKEFLMDDSLPGTWQINAKYLGNRKLTASYLKATIYHNYGLETQRKETKVFKLGLKNVNQQLFSLHTNEVALSE